MYKKIILFLLIIVITVFFSGCSKKKVTNRDNDKTGFRIQNLEEDFKGHENKDLKIQLAYPEGWNIINCENNSDCLKLFKVIKTKTTNGQAEIYITKLSNFSLSLADIENELDNPIGLSRTFIGGYEFINYSLPGHVFGIEEYFKGIIDDNLYTFRVKYVNYNIRNKETEKIFNSIIFSGKKGNNEKLFSWDDIVKKSGNQNNPEILDLYIGEDIPQCFEKNYNKRSLASSTLEYLGIEEYAKEGYKIEDICAEDRLVGFILAKKELNLYIPEQDKHYCENNCDKDIFGLVDLDTRERKILKYDETLGIYSEAYSMYCRIDKVINEEKEFNSASILFYCGAGELGGFSVWKKYDFEGNRVENIQRLKSLGDNYNDTYIINSKEFLELFRNQSRKEIYKK